MPRVEILTGHHLQAVKERVPEVFGGEPQSVDTWTLVMTDMNTQDQIRISFRQDTRDVIVSQLTGGIVLAGGELPKL